LMQYATGPFSNKAYRQTSHLPGIQNRMPLRKVNIYD
jgi:hypothetical protein